MAGLTDEQSSRVHPWHQVRFIRWRLGAAPTRTLENEENWPLFGDAPEEIEALDRCCPSRSSLMHDTILT